jgi:hypothetical protein
MVFMLHVVNGVAEMFLTESDGHRSDLRRPSTKVNLGALQELHGLGYDDYQVGEVTAFYDPKDRRYAIIWSTYSDQRDLDSAPPVFVAVSQSRNPLSDWTVWALDLRPSLAKGYEFCHNCPKGQYKFEFPQVRHAVQCSTVRYSAAQFAAAGSAGLATLKTIAVSCHSCEGCFRARHTPQGAGGPLATLVTTPAFTLPVAPPCPAASTCNPLCKLMRRPTHDSDVRPPVLLLAADCLTFSECTSRVNTRTQVSFSHDGIFISGSSTCPGEAGQPRVSLAALYVLPKAALYSKPPATNEDAEIKAAVYIVRNSWYRSITKNELSLVPDGFEPLNSIPCPARPQTIEDMKAAPIFVLKVGTGGRAEP